MKTKLILVSVLFWAIGCFRNTNNHDEKSSEKQMEDTMNKQVVKPVTDFYDWYINTSYGKISEVPSLIQKNDSIYVYNENELREYLSTVPHLSEKFIENEMMKLAKCNDALQFISWEEKPEGDFNVEPCNYLWSYQWVGGQGDEITNFKISTISENQDSYSVIVQIMAQNVEHVKSEVLVSKVSLKIDNIELIWE